MVRFVHTLSAASTPAQVKRTFAMGFGRLFGVPCTDTTSTTRSAVTPPAATRPVNVSDAFVAAYELHGRHVDPVLAKAHESRRAAYNLALMSAEEWEQCPVYRVAYRRHSVRHVVTVPVLNGGELLGNVHFATSDPERNFVSEDLRVADALAGLLGSTLASIDRYVEVERERDRARAALELAGTPVVVSDPGSPELQLNDGARRLLADVRDVDEKLHRLLARSPDHRPCSRRIEVELVTGERATVHSHTSPVDGEYGGLVAVLELEREFAVISPRALAPLTPREQEVAALVPDGLSDREIAAHVNLSHHTVTQYVKRIYRRLGVDSRVSLIRVLLRPPRRE